MNMNAGIILSGRGPDIGNALGQGVRNAGMANAVGRDNALASLYQEQGAGLLQGDPGAYNALAALDPMAARGLQQQDRAEARATRSEGRADQQLQLAMEAGAREAARFKMDQAKVAEAEQDIAIIQDLMPLYKQAQQTGDMRGFNQRAAEYGLTAEEFPTHVAVATGMMSELYKDMQPAQPDYAVTDGQYYDKNNPAAGAQPIPNLRQEQADPMSAIGKLRADLAANRITEEDFKREIERMAPKGTRLVSDGQGGFTFEDNVPVGGDVPNLTVEGGKNTGFLIRTQDANKVLSELEDQGLDFFQQAAENAPLGLGNYARTPEFQKFDQARRNFVNAILRRESGAVISEEEFDNANKQYFPVPGDSPEVIAQKRQNREAAIEGLRLGSGEGAGYVDRMRAQESQEAEPDIPEVPDFSAMSNEELDAYIESLSK